MTFPRAASVFRVIAIVFAVSIAAAGCFSPDEPPCSFACGPALACPDDYRCLPDGYCHLHGRMSSCGYPDGGLRDLSAPQPDQAGMQDLSSSSIDM